MRLVIPERHAEAITSRPLMLHALGKQTTHAGQTRITITSMHAEAKRIQKVLTNLTSFLGWIRETAEQLDWDTRWRLILSRNLSGFWLEGTFKAPLLCLNLLLNYRIWDYESLVNSNSCVFIPFCQYSDDLSIVFFEE